MARILSRPWHEVFSDCVLPYTDCPDTFIAWSALSLISAALKNNVFFEVGTYTLFPNMFVVLVAPPGVGKGTAMDIVETLNNDNKANKIVNTLNDRVTAEKMIETIADGWTKPPRMQGTQMIIPPKDHCCLIFSTEVRTLLGSSNWMLEFLEEAWSKKSFDYQTKNKGSIFIDNMCCSLLAASVPDFLRNVNKEAHMVITGGFSSRCLFIYADSPGKDLPFPEALKRNKKSKAVYDELVLDLRTIANLHGEFKVDSTARVIFENFLKTNRKLAADSNSEAEINFRARLKAHVLKLAMVFSVSRGDTLVINQVDMINSISECQKIIVNINKLFRGAGEGMDTTSIARVQDIIERLGTTTKNEIFKLVYRHISNDGLDRVLYVLESIGFCERKEVGKKTMYQHTPKKGATKP